MRHDHATADRSHDAASEVPGLTLTGLREDDLHVLLWQARGRTWCEVEGSPVSLSAGDALWIPARARHRLSTAPDSALLPMFFDARRHATPTEAVEVVSVDAETESLFLALIGSQYSLLRPAADLERRVLAAVEARLATAGELRMPLTPVARRLARSVVLDPADQRGLREWAEELHVSSRTLERAFRSETGASWHQWRHHQRMQRAAHLLRTTPIPVTEVARRVGFDSSSSFARAFREHHGRTPTRHRRTSQQRRAAG